MTTQVGASLRPVAGEPNGPAENLACPVGWPLPVIPLSERVEAMAENPARRILNREAAMEYFRAMVRDRLAATDGLLRHTLPIPLASGAEALW